VCLGTPKDVELFDSYQKIYNHLNGNTIDATKTWEYFKTKIFN
jgi:hypothetical protein